MKGIRYRRVCEERWTGRKVRRGARRGDERRETRGRRNCVKKSIEKPNHSRDERAWRGAADKGFRKCGM